MKLPTAQKVRHVVALVLFVAGWLVKELQAAPDVESALHITGAMMSIAGFVLAALNQALLGGAPPTPPISGGLLSVLGIVVMGALGQGCQLNPAVVTDVNAGLKLAACMWGVYSRDESQTPPAAWPVVAVDMGGTCGADVGDIVNLFGATSSLGQAAIANPEPVHAAVLKFKRVASLSGYIPEPAF